MDFKNFLSKNKDIDILSNIPDGVILVNADEEIEWINEKAANIFNEEKSLLIKRNISDLIESGFDIIKQVASNGQSAIGKVRIESLNIYLEITAQNVQTSYVVSVRDVTKNYKTVTNMMIERESSKKNNKDKNNFLVKLSNEFKSPLQTIVGFSQAMMEGLGGEMSEKQDKYVKIINKNSQDALYFMNKMIDLAKTESKMFEFNTQIFDVINTSQNIIKDFESEAKNKNLELIFNADEISKKSIFSDEDALKLILKNIFEISLSMTEMGSISFKISHPDIDTVASQGYEVPENEDEYNKKTYLLFTISDTGEGYSEQEKELLFEPYLQLDKPNRKNIVRSIALASVKNLINHLKGKIWIESELMQGTTYHVIIPLAR